MVLSVCCDCDWSDLSARAGDTLVFVVQKRPLLACARHCCASHVRFCCMCTARHISSAVNEGGLESEFLLHQCITDILQFIRIVNHTLYISSGICIVQGKER